MRRFLFLPFLASSLCFAGTSTVAPGNGRLTVAPGSGRMAISYGVFPPGRLAFTATTETTGSTSWDSVLLPPATGYAVRYSTASDFSGTVLTSSTINTSATISSLSVNTTYYAQVAAFNTGSFSGFSAIQVASATMSNVPVTAGSTWSALSSSGFAVTWGANGNPSYTSYEAQISTVNGFGSGTTTSSITLNVSSTFTALTAATTYYGRVRSINIAGTPSNFLTLGSTVTNPSAAAIAIVGSSVTSFATDTTALQSVSFTQSAGTNRVGVAIIAMYQGGGIMPTVSSASWGTGAMTLVVSTTHVNGTDRTSVEIWAIKEASLPSNGTFNVVFNINNGGNSTEKAMGAVLFSGADQTTTWRDTDGTSGSGTSTSVTLTTVSGDWAIDALNTFAGDPTIGANQNLLFYADPTGTVTSCYTTYELASGASVTMSESFSSQEFAYIGATLMKAP